MKTIHFVNTIATGITLFLYLLIFYGMMAQVILGPLQLLLALIISIKYYDKLDQHNQILMMFYWFMALIALIVAAVTWFSNANETNAIIWLFVLPMLVACYFLYVTKSVHTYVDNQKEEV